LGNVLATISDKKKGYDTTGDGQVDYFLADTRQATDYHPFGWGMIGRSGTYNLFGYKYGFNGKENDKETTTQDYGMRIYDPRLGRFLSVDPITADYPELTPYQFASNRPIDGIDLDGKEWAQETIFKSEKGKLVVENQMTVKVKVENKSTIVTDANIIKAKAELFKSSLEQKYSGESTANLFGVPFTIRYKTEAVLDYSAPSPDDLPTIGHLVFDDRTSGAKTVTTVTTGNTTTTTTLTPSVPGDTRGIVNQFFIGIGIAMDGAMVSDNDLIPTFQHEGGHSAGLKHPWNLSDVEKKLVPELNQNSTPPANVNKVKNNLLNSPENPNPLYNANSGTDILPGQMGAMNKTIKDKSYYTPAELKSKDKPKNQ
jgi:RHS repeat-associated protein